MLVPPLDNWLSMMMPLVPPNALGAVTHVLVGFPAEQVPGAGNPAVKLELSTNPSPLPPALPTPKNNLSVVPLENSVNGEHSSPLVLFTTQVASPVGVIK